METYFFIAKDYPTNEPEQTTEEMLEAFEEIAVRRHELFVDPAHSTLGEDLIRGMGDDYDEILSVTAAALEKLMRWDHERAVADVMAEGGVA